MHEGSCVADLHCSLRALCRHVSTLNSKVEEGQSKGAAELAVKWAEKYASFDEKTPSDVAGEQLQVWGHAWLLSVVRYVHCLSSFHGFQLCLSAP